MQPPDPPDARGSVDLTWQDMDPVIPFSYWGYIKQRYPKMIKMDGL